MLISRIIEQINKEFPYFSTLHQFLSTRPNIAPPAVTTGVGPLGRRVIHYQPPSTSHEPFSDELIDPALRNLSTPESASPPASISAASVPISSTSTGLPISENSGSISKQPPKPSTFGLADAIEKAKTTIKKVSTTKKRSLEDMLVDISR